ncbi:MAG TPA: thioredoxin family protein [Nitrospirota bacterium]
MAGSNTSSAEGLLDIKVLGPGCRNCLKLKEMILGAVSVLGLDVKVVHVSDIVEIMKYVNATPGLVVNGKVKHSGNPLPSRDKVVELIREEM